MKCSFEPYEGDQPFVFVSYCHKNRGKVYPIIERLHQSGYRIWYDAGIELGTEWPEVIATHLNRGSAVLAFLSVASTDSHNCRREISHAILKQKPLMVVYLEETQLTPGMELQLASIQSICAYRFSSEEEIARALAETPILQPCLGAPNEDIRVSSFSGEQQLQQSSDHSSAKQKTIPFVLPQFCNGDPDGTALLNAPVANETVSLISSCMAALQPRAVLFQVRTGETFVFKSDVTIGRSDEACTYVIKNPYIGRRHATIKVYPEKVCLADHSSANGTFVNGRHIAANDEIVLQHADRILFGNEMTIFFYVLLPAQEDYAAHIQYQLLRVGSDKAYGVKTSPFRIGRSTDIELSCPDEKHLGRHHADIVLHGMKCFLRDNDSKNHTYVNGAMIGSGEEIQVYPDDKIRFADCEFELGIGIV